MFRDQHGTFDHHTLMRLVLGLNLMDLGRQARTQFIVRAERALAPDNGVRSLRDIERLAALRRFATDLTGDPVIREFRLTKGQFTPK